MPLPLNLLSTLVLRPVGRHLFDSPPFRRFGCGSFQLLTLLSLLPRELVGLLSSELVGLLSSELVGLLSSELVGLLSSERFLSVPFLRSNPLVLCAHSRVGLTRVLRFIRLSGTLVRHLGSMGRLRRFSLQRYAGPGRLRRDTASLSSRKVSLAEPPFTVADAHSHPASVAVEPRFAKECHTGSP
jgi:hypothetical protein